MLIFFAALIGITVTIQTVLYKYNFYQRNPFGISCDFCVGFWIQMVICLVAAISFENWYLLIMPFLAAGIANRI